MRSLPLLATILIVFAFQVFASGFLGGVGDGNFAVDGDLGDGNVTVLGGIGTGSHRIAVADRTAQGTDWVGEGGGPNFTGENCGNN